MTCLASRVRGGKKSLVRFLVFTLMLSLVLSATPALAGETVVDGTIEAITDWSDIDPDILGNVVRNGGTLHSSGTLRIGNSGTGTLDIESVGTASADQTIYLGYETGSKGTVTVDGSGSKLNTTLVLYVGRNGVGELSITGGGTVSAGTASSDPSIYLGYYTGSEGTVTVDGPGSELQAAVDIYVGGDYGTGTMVITDGGTASADKSILLGYNTGSEGEVTVDGNGSELRAAVNLYVGRFGTGTLTITNGGKAFVGQDIYFGYYTVGSEGTVTVEGSGSELHATGIISVGDEGTGTLEIKDGGTASATNIYLGDFESGAKGTVTVEGNGSELRATGSLVVGRDGTGELEIKNGGTARAASISVNASSGITVSDTGTLGAGNFTGGITNNGTILFDQSVNQTLSGAISGAGSLTKSGTGTLTLSGANTYSGATIINSGGLTVTGSLGAGNYAGNITNNGTILFDQSVNQTLSGAISGSGSLVKNGTGTLTLSGANDYTGMTTVLSGTLELGSDLASDNLMLYGNTSFKRSAHAHSLDNGNLTVWGSNSTYDGNLSAQNANLHFIADGAATGSMLSVTGTANIDGSAVNVGVSGGYSFASGTRLSLLKTINNANGLTGAVTQGDGTGILQTGATVVQDITLETTANELIATIGKSGATEGAKALSEGFLAGLALTTQGADVIAGQGMESAAQAARAAEIDSGGPSMAAFGTLSGDSVRYSTGSHVDMKSFSMMTGFALGTNTALGRATGGVFFEYGNGNYDTHNSFSNAPGVNGDGDACFLGGGVLGRMEFNSAGSGRAYAEASVRAGRLHTEYGSADLRDAAGRAAAYDSSTAYYGAHLGGGYVWNLTDKVSLDLHGKYFWTRQEGDSVSLSTGESVRFEDADSHRLRGGVRFAYNRNGHVSPYVGAAYEHEFDGKAGAATNGIGIDAPELKGGAGMGEIGVTLRPSGSLPLSVDLGVRGYVGKREGVTGSLQFALKF